MNTPLTAVVRTLYADFARGDIESIVASFADDILFIHRGGPEVAYARDRQGKAQAAAFFSDLMASVEVSRFEPQRYVEQGDTVVALGRWSARGRNSGKAFESDWAMVWRFEGGKVVFYQNFEDTLAVARALRP